MVVSVCFTPGTYSLNRWNNKSVMAARIRQPPVWDKRHDLTDVCTGRATQQSFIRGGSAPRSKPLSFYIPFLS